MASWRSVHVFTSHSVAGQRQIRLRQPITTGRPPDGKSRTFTVLRPLLTARHPHARHHARLVVVSINCQSSPSSSTAPTRTKPAMPTSAAALSLPSNPTRGLP
jgi:hypothetical protein